MIKKTITYKDFNGDEVTEDLYFHLSQADIVAINMNALREGGLEGVLREMQATSDGARMWSLLEELIAKSYGIKSPDGKRFIKTPEMLENFKSTNGYSELIVGLISDPEGAAAFINGMVPQDLAESADRMSKAQEVQQRVEAREAARSSTRSHPSDSAAEPQTPNLEADPTAVEPGNTSRNAFENTAEPRLLTDEEIRAMDIGELRSGLSEGRYKLQ